MSEQLPAAGWYVNAEGQTQWWDGTAWGQLASEFESDAADSAESGSADSEGAASGSDSSDLTEASHQPVAQEFSREFLEQQYGVGRAEGAEQSGSDADSSVNNDADDAQVLADEASPVDGGGSSDSSLTDPVAEWAAASYAPPSSTPQAPAAPQAPNAYAPPAQPQAPAYPQAPQASGQINGQYSVQYSQQFPAPAYLQQAPQTSKPPTHITAWFALGAVALGLILTIIGSFSGLGWLIPLAVLAVVGGIALSIIALIKSQKKGIPVTGLVLSASGIFWVPIIALIGVFVYFANDTSMLYSL